METTINLDGRIFIGDILIEQDNVYGFFLVSKNEIDRHGTHKHSVVGVFQLLDNAIEYAKSL